MSPDDVFELLNQLHILRWYSPIVQGPRLQQNHTHSPAHVVRNEFSCWIKLWFLEMWGGGDFNTFISSSMVPMIGGSLTYKEQSAFINHSRELQRRQNSTLGIISNDISELFLRTWSRFNFARSTRRLPLLQNSTWKCCSFWYAWSLFLSSRLES